MHTYQYVNLSVLKKEELKWARPPGKGAFKCKSEMERVAALKFNGR